MSGLEKDNFEKQTFKSLNINDVKLITGGGLRRPSSLYYELQ